ncbi:MAG: tRNA pseudouridine(55) synthase TruB [Bacteroidales bacterium]|nr:tRNA pseudouridine(55) synthase TruB [Bacteroidales bacterium]
MIFKQGITREEIIDGVFILIHKPWGWSSFDVVNKIKQSIKFNFKQKKIKVGHAGTLDPMAEGLVVIGTGKMTKKLFDNQQADKEYVARIQLGETSSSYDSETTPVKSGETEAIMLSDIERALESFRGTIMQEPPLFSAKWVDGSRAYELARKGSDLKLDAVEVRINILEIVSFQNPELILRVNCSKGTYIRSLANDLGRSLGCGAWLSGLIRTKSGSYLLEDAIQIADFDSIMKTLGENFPQE